MSAVGFSYPLPTSVLLMDVKSTTVRAELQLPLGELQYALQEDVMNSPETLVLRLDLAEQLTD